MRLAVLIAGLSIALGAQAQEIYKWVDKDGIVHYADQPGAPDAQRIVIVGAEPPAQDAGPAAGPGAGAPAEEPPEEPAYTSLSIVSPAPDEAFFGPNLTIPVVVETDAELRPGDQLLVFLDGNRVPGQGLEATLTGVTRGSHFLRAAIVDASGRVLVSSPQQTFHVRAPSVATPPTGPNVNLPQPGTRPRPTPLPANRGN